MEKLNQVLLRDDVRVGADLEAWLAIGGGEGLAKALCDPGAVIGEIEQADLRGMGGAGFATHRKWAPVAAAADGDKTIICNGNEDEPGTFKDRFLLEHTPHQVIEGALIAAAATRANHIVLYVNPHQQQAIAVIRQAVGQWQAHPRYAELERLLGAPLSLGVVPSSGLYIGGEETAVIASVEGGFPFPRRKPPFPSQQGVHGAPSIVNNVETLAHIPGILRHGAQWYRDLGIGNATGTKLYSLSGDVLRPGLYELPMGTSLESLVFEHGGGMLQGKEFKAVFTGGPSNTLLTKRDLDVALDFDSVRLRRSRLGTGAMIVVSEGTSIVRKVAEFVSFFAQGSCGQCPPCKGGSFQLMRLLNRIDTGRGVHADLAALENLCRILPGSGRCGLIDGAVTVVESSLHQFREEYEALLMA
ncbi:NADH-quinone oxidoreductase subunit F [Cupriavidus metallidurans]|jgi:NADH-quinone oxidoreductase subunit F|uniref:NADH:ubiquinone oxidoreductase complex I, chain F n=1 Tax=Cupriavidus metallidurans (strain ATCC 43123 / DSM 2839 / NBRC 102507 / CH34) TaxID=266264 RepID=Q1LFB0_CUPMC|nr:NADH-ubiquinone oxidoreductase-F iron-sulfur binding region domain-containing protein [Cupriavidus metallidurans]ABF11166.1 NADH:ubiquinone oxidoreductase complex I, chain F [Cupriavidus metallidurans CH34]KWW39346.1 NADH-quinone oxidoreductase subunit F [Cupriavidus metallidurans]MDE4920565.1 NADH-ubiquinone oxidoreductase-F iron-sulfur binding region domain-containing protein [Cupriavidus metallidurans]QGS33104.1 NADH-quinone oxidoreductase subunit F [Cupriavidus metallidurans]UBM07638.1 